MDEISFKEFLESIPPGKEMIVTDFSTKKSGSSGIYSSNPQLQLHCTSEECQGKRFFVSLDSEWLPIDKAKNLHLTFVCRNCRKNIKTYSLKAKKISNLGKFNIIKYGEIPAYGPPTPSRAFKLIGGERELFFLGRRNENQGMGIGAFVYYRRVIESQKNRIFDELIRVIEKISPDHAVLVELKAAKQETQFTKAVESIKHALPQSLSINGYNPLTLLHSALSEGVHAHNDKECLELANSIRTVLFEFAERLGESLKEEVELNAAINRLANNNSINKKIKS